MVSLTEDSVGPSTERAWGKLHMADFATHYPKLILSTQKDLLATEWQIPWDQCPCSLGFVRAGTAISHPQGPAWWASTLPATLKPLERFPRSGSQTPHQAGPVPQAIG